jgi:hypothetical protein
MDWITYQLQNQKMLQQIFLENRHKVRLAKNRIEKFRARIKKQNFEKTKILFLMDLIVLCLYLFLYIFHMTFYIFLFEKKIEMDF